jgi:selenoprotein W-related protein
LTGLLLESLKQKIHSLTLIPDGGGCFELKINGELIYSKLETGEFPDEKWALKQVSARAK